MLLLAVLVKIETKTASLRTFITHFALSISCFASMSLPSHLPCEFRTRENIVPKKKEEFFVMYFMKNKKQVLLFYFFCK